MITRKIARVHVQQWLRRSGLLKPVETLRFQWKRIRLARKNRAFVLQNPNFSLPPEALAFDAYSSQHWEFYKVSGELTARFITGIIDRYVPRIANGRSVFEWGCGPARITRQMLQFLDPADQLFASDYNADSISWCRDHIPGIRFEVNQLLPPLPFPSNRFDFIYAASVVTHLSGETSQLWMDELWRILKPGGHLLITTDTTHAYHTELLPAEKRCFEEQGLVVRARYEEGKKMYLARHSAAYVKETLLRNFALLEHVPSLFPFMRQDYWIARKPPL